MCQPLMGMNDPQKLLGAIYSPTIAQNKASQLFVWQFNLKHYWTAVGVAVSC